MAVIQRRIRRRGRTTLIRRKPKVISTGDKIKLLTKYRKVKFVVYNEDYPQDLEMEVEIDYKEIRSREDLIDQIKEQILDYFGYGKRRRKWKKYLDQSLSEGLWHVEKLEFEEFIDEIKKYKNIIVREVKFEGKVYRKWTEKKGKVEVWRDEKGHKFSFQKLWKEVKRELESLRERRRSLLKLGRDLDIIDRIRLRRLEKREKLLRLYK